MDVCSSLIDSLWRDKNFVGYNVDGVRLALLAQNSKSSLLSPTPSLFPELCKTAKTRYRQAHFTYKLSVDVEGQARKEFNVRNPKYHLKGERRRRNSAASFSCSGELPNDGGKSSNRLVRGLHGTIWRECILEIADQEALRHQAINLEMDFILKEREKIAVLKELEMHKRIANDLKLRLPKETSKSIHSADRINSDILKLRLNPDAEKMRPKNLQKCASSVVLTTSLRQSPSLILMELQQAKMNLVRSTCGISGIRASIELLKSVIAKEEAMLEKSRERLRLDTAKVSSLEENLKKSITELKLIQDAQSKHNKNSEDVSNQITELGLEKEGFERIAEGAKADAARLISDIEHIKSCIKAAEAAETALVAEKAARSRNHPEKYEHKMPSRVTLSLEEYTELICKARQSDEKSKKTIEAAMARVREASQSNHNLHMKVEEAIAEVGARRKALKEAQKREEVANREKLAADEALRRWFSTQKNNTSAMAPTAVDSNREMLKEALEREELANKGKLSGDEDLPWWTIKRKHKTHSAQNPTKFKKSSSVPHRTETRILDVNGMSLATAGRSRRLSIGQILSIKLMETEEYEKGIGERAIERPRISLGQLLSQRHELMSPTRTNVNNACTKFSGKRRKFGFICLSLILAKQNKRGKNQRRAWSLQSNCRALVV